MNVNFTKRTEATEFIIDVAAVFVAAAKAPAEIQHNAVGLIRRVWRNANPEARALLAMSVSDMRRPRTELLGWASFQFKILAREEGREFRRKKKGAQA